MPLPAGGPWPPKDFTQVYDRLRSWSAWYSGNPDELGLVYGSATSYDQTSRERIQNHPSQYRGGVVGLFARWFWGEPMPLGQKRTKLHVPLAADIAATSADLLFSEPPAMTVADTGTQDRVDQLAGDGMHATLLEAAEAGAALGGVYLRVVWDNEIHNRPWLNAVHADAAIPEWQWDRLSALTVWREITRDGNVVVRHLERHEPGVILHGLFAGSAQQLGKPIGLSAYPETENLQPEVRTGVKTLTAVYVPNMRPNRLWRSMPQAMYCGRSDYSGSEPLLDALDEVYSSWMRDVRLAKARLLVPDAYLQSAGPGRGALFDAEREVFTGLQMLAGPDKGSMITPAQFAIRVDEHQRT
ncbi:MAG: hypothetical protein L0Y54_17805, partial [Sporichthyaceae bacterium]|nr:hypothetical protein [Sporichthyaceae bacterium]